MGNLGGGEILVILVVALMVLGPTRLPEAARQIGKATRELRRMSGSFQRELKAALDEPLAETRTAIKDIESTVKAPVTPKPLTPFKPATSSNPATPSKQATPSEPITSSPRATPATGTPPDPIETTGMVAEAPQSDESETTER